MVLVLDFGSPSPFKVSLIFGGLSGFTSDLERKLDFGRSYGVVRDASIRSSSDSGSFSYSFKANTNMYVSVSIKYPFD